MKAVLKSWSLFSAVVTLGVSILSLVYSNNAELSGMTYNYEWLKFIGASFAVGLRWCGSTAYSYLLLLLFHSSSLLSYKHSYKNTHLYFMASCFYHSAGLMGVFTAMDALLFYFFWELGTNTRLFSLQQMGRRKKNTGHF